MEDDPYETDYTEGRLTSLRDFTILKHLRIGVKLLVVLAHASINKGSLDEAWFSLVDILLLHLEYLSILGYTIGVNSEHDAQITYPMEDGDSHHY